MRRIGHAWQALMLVAGTLSCLYLIASTLIGTVLT